MGKRQEGKVGEGGRDEGRSRGERESELTHSITQNAITLGKSQGSTVKEIPKRILATIPSQLRSGVWTGFDNPLYIR